MGLCLWDSTDNGQAEMWEDGSVYERTCVCICSASSCWVRAGAPLGAGCYLPGPGFCSFSLITVFQPHFFKKNGKQWYKLLSRE